MASLLKVCRRRACGCARTVRRACRSATRPMPEAIAETSLPGKWRCSANQKPSTLPGHFLLIRRGVGGLTLGFAQRSLLLLFSLFFLGACACHPLSLGPVSTIIRLECHWLPPCPAG